MPLPKLDFEAAIVDLDGTMVDTDGDFEAALTRALADRGWPPVSRAFTARTVGKGSEYRWVAMAVLVSAQTKME